MQFYGKKEALVLSSLSVMLMLWHHLFGFLEYHPELCVRPFLGQAFMPIVILLGQSGNICVGIFAMMSGYAVAVNSEVYRSINDIARRGWKFLSTYWLILALFVFASYISPYDSPPPYKVLICNMLGLFVERDYFTVRFAWYVNYYLMFLLSAPLLARFINRYSKLKWYICLIMVSVLCIWLLFVVVIRANFNVLIKETVFNLYPAYSALIGLTVGKFNVFSLVSLKKC